MTMTVKLERKAVAAAPAGTARARVTSYNVLHADGDVVMPGSLENEWAMVSRASHSASVGSEPLVGYAKLSEEPDGLYAAITYFDAGACELARETPWSVTYVATSWREPTPAERAKFGEGLKRVILAWKVLEVSPVNEPASPGTRSGKVCCGGECTVGGKSCCAPCATRAAVVREAARFEMLRSKWILSDIQRRRAALADDWAVLAQAELKASEVPRAMREAAEEAVRLGAEVLGGPPPAVRWYGWSAALEVGAKGLHFTGEPVVWIARRDDGDDEATYRTALHEVGHAKGLAEPAAQHFADALSVLRGVELRIGDRQRFEGRREPAYVIPGLAGFAGYRRQGAVDVGALVVDSGRL